MEGRHQFRQSRTKLTSREEQVISLISKGKVNREIADILGISYYTVKHHVTMILLKLNANTRAMAVARRLAEK